MRVSGTSPALAAAAALGIALGFGAGCSKDEPKPAKQPDALAQELARAKEVGVAMERAIAAAKEAEAGGATVCDKAFLGLVRASQVLESERPDVATPPPQESKFMDACAALPEPAQQCLVMTYAVDHVADCRVITDALPPEQRAVIESAMRSGSTP